MVAWVLLEVVKTRQSCGKPTQVGERPQGYAFVL